VTERVVSTVESCPQCSFPMVWSDDQRRMWCSVYGSHITHAPHGVVCICLRCVTRRAA
jgi:primosomal protein N'